MVKLMSTTELLKKRIIAHFNFDGAAMAECDDVGDSRRHRPTYRNKLAEMFLHWPDSRLREFCSGDIQKT